MRYVKLVVNDGQRGAVLSVLDEEDIDYLLVGAADGTVVEFPLPDQAVEYVRGRLEQAGFDGEYVVTMGAESADTERFGELEDRFITGTEEGDSVAADELRSKTLELHPDPLPYYAMTLVSAIVAVAGLLLDSAALVVGAMVIAPQVGSALSVSVGGALGDWSMIKRGARAQAASVALAVVGAAAFALLMQWLGFVPSVAEPETLTQIGERTSPGVLAISVGVAAGVAAAFGLSTALPVSIVGVMIAAALIPAAAATGIGIAWRTPSVVVAAAAMLVVSLLAINLSGLLTFRVLGYAPGDASRSHPSRVWTAVAAVVLVVAVASLGAAVVTQAAFQNDVNTAATDVLSEDEYDDLGLVKVRTDLAVAPATDTPTVTVVVNRPANEPYPEFALAVGDEIADRSDREVAVTVEFVERRQYDPGGSPRE